MSKIFSGLFTLLLCSIQLAYAQTGKERWVDSVFNQLNEQEKIGQLFMMPVSSHLEEDKRNDIERDIKTHNPGGILFTTGHPTKQVSATNQFQSASKVPLLISFDAANGLGTFLDSTITFPTSLALGALPSDSMVFTVAKEIGRQLNVLGVNMNLSPMANLFDKNDLAFRSKVFGENKAMVSAKLIAYLNGMQSQGILSCAKYFPIQGITITDIEKGIPVTHPFVDSVQAYPFQQLFKQGIDAVMPASNELPVFYEKKKAARKNKFSSSMLSTFFAGDWIKKQMNFNGLVVVDIRILEGASKQLKNADAELFAFQAGNDILITDNNPAPAIRKIRKLLKKQKQYRAQLNNSVRKILAAKYDARLGSKKRINNQNILLKLNTPEAIVLQQHIFKAAITVVRNENNTIPLLSLENRKIASIIVGDTSKVFHHMISKYAQVAKASVTKDEDLKKISGFMETHDVLIVALTSKSSKEWLDKVVPILKNTKPDQAIIIADFGCAALSVYANDFTNIITGYSDQREMFEAMPQVIFGGAGSNGILPIAMGNTLAGSTLKTKSIKRFEYSVPEDAGMSGKTLKKIEAIAKEAIAIGGTPGCHVLVAKDGKVIYEKSFGYLTYENQVRVSDSTIYDLASVTKVSATLQAIMFLHDRGMIDVNKKASVYLPELKNSNKKDFTLKDILTHQAGLWPFLPFWAQTVRDTFFLPVYYERKPSLQYPFVVSDKLYASVAMKDSLWNWIMRAKIREKPARTPFDYKYSDMGFYMMQHLAEKILNQPMEDFLGQNLYEPLGAYTTGYLPLLRFPINQIAPTENDKLFRRALLIGTVHDQGAAMHGGVAGHAGLFSTANDLAKLGQMLLQDGNYGGYQYYKPETVRFFTSKQFETSRRGLGWDKPVQSDPNSPTSMFASPRTFGHTGFTGTCIWVDPEFNLVYVFLSNRVHPDMTNNKLLNANIRSRIQNVIYESIFDYRKTEKVDFLIKTNLNSSSRLVAEQ